MEQGECSLKVETSDVVIAQQSCEGAHRVTKAPCEDGLETAISYVQDFEGKRVALACESVRLPEAAK